MWNNYFIQVTARNESNLLTFFEKTEKKVSIFIFCMDSIRVVPVLSRSHINKILMCLFGRLISIEDHLFHVNSLSLHFLVNVNR